MLLFGRSQRRSSAPTRLAQIISYGFGCFSQSRPEHFQQRAELPALRNSSLRPLAVAVLPIPFARWPSATYCPSVQATSPLLRRWAPAGLAAPGPRSASKGVLEL